MLIISACVDVLSNEICGKYSNWKSIINTRTWVVHLLGNIHRRALVLGIPEGIKRIVPSYTEELC